MLRFNLITQGVGKILRKFIASGLLKHVLISTDEDTAEYVLLLSN